MILARTTGLGEQENIKKIFRFFDSNRDGFITIGELKFALDSLEGEKAWLCSNKT